jgi:ribosome biogenesis protein UTP30
VLIVRVRPLPHPALPPPPKSSVCLFVKNPQREYKDLLAAHNIKFVDRVVGLDKLRGKHKPFEARRALMKAHDIFLCDARIMPSMPKLLGKIFFDAKK